MNPTIEPTQINERIASHSSALTNLRLHQLEMGVDAARIQVGQNPTVESVDTYRAYLKAWFSYFQSLRAEEKLNDANALHDPVAKEIMDIRKRMNELDEYWNCIRLGVLGKAVLEIKKQHPANYKVIIQSRMITLCDKIGDTLRRAYQARDYYFRTDKDTGVRGIAGDLSVAKEKMKDYRPVEVKREQSA